MNNIKIVLGPRGVIIHRVLYRVYTAFDRVLMYRNRNVFLIGHTIYFTPTVPFIHVLNFCTTG